MHILTKVLVITAAVLSVFLAALTIAYSTNAERIVSQFQAERNLKVAALGALDAAKGQAGEEQARLNAQIEKLYGDLATRTADFNRLEAGITTLQGEKAKALADYQSLQAKIAELGETAKTQANLITSYRDEVTTLRKNELTYRQQALEMDDRLSDLESQREVLEQTVRALQEQLAEARTQQETLVQGGPGAVSATGLKSAEPFVSSGPLVAGRVESVSKDAATGALLAKINLGSNDLVRENQKLFVGRGGEFVANVVVLKTDLKWSIARIDTLGRAVEVREGDQVLSRLQ
ncbi:MAG: hypothetical protein IT436_04575 [Phycisphaerales bacterium]|nr:hypothetical protein [Phycisphaerales bacterium]